MDLKMRGFEMKRSENGVLVLVDGWMDGLVSFRSDSAGAERKGKEEGSNSCACMHAS